MSQQHSGQYKEPWKDFLAWTAQLYIQVEDIYETRTEMVAIYT